MSKRKYDEFSEFRGAMMALGVRAVVVRTTREIRPTVEEGFQVMVGHVHFLELLAYHAGTVHQCVLDGARRDEVDAWILEHGIETRRVSGNIQ